METKCHIRKRIWQIECNALDYVIATSFEWREIINLLQGFKHRFDLDQLDSVLELQTQTCLHQHCHGENNISKAVESLLNLWHQDMIEAMDDLELRQIKDYIMHLDFKEARDDVKGLIWALSTDPREGMKALRQRLIVRYQLAACRGQA